MAEAQAEAKEEEAREGRCGCGAAPQILHWSSGQGLTNAVRLAIEANGARHEFEVLEEFGESMAYDTGQTLWESSIVLARWLASNAGTFAGTRVAELGCGTAFPSIVLSTFCLDCHVVATDKDERVIQVARGNIEANPSAANVRTSLLDWSLIGEDLSHSFDMVIASDVCYREEIVGLFVNAATSLLNRNGQVWIVTPDKRQGVELLLKDFRQRGWEISVVRAPEDMYANPLASGDEGDFVSTFFRFFTDKFVLVHALCTDEHTT